MDWLGIAAIALVCLGLVAGAFLFARSPSFWIEFGYRLFEKLWPYLFKYISKRMTPEEEAAMRACVRSGGEWDHARRRCKNR